MSLTPSELDALAERLAEKVAAKMSEQPACVDRVELARRLGCSVPTIERRVAAGDIPVIRLGRRTVFDVAAVVAALNEKGARP